MQEHSAAPNSEPLPSVKSFLASYLLLVGACIWLSHEPGNVTTLWYANAFCAAYLSQLPPARWWRILALSGASLLAVNWGWSQSLSLSISFLPANFLESVLAATAIRQLGRKGRLESNPWVMALLLLCGALITPLVGALWGGLALQWNGFATLGHVWPTWYAGSIVGAAAMLPLAALLMRVGWRGFIAQLQVVELVICVALVSGVVIAATAYLPHPFVYVVMVLIGAALWLNAAGLFFIVFVASWVLAMAIVKGYFILPPTTSQWDVLLSYVPFFMTISIPIILSASMGAIQEKEHERDVAQKRTNDLLARFQKIALHVPGALFQFQLKPDGSTSFPYASDGMRAIYHVEPHQVQHDATPVYERIHVEDFERVQKSIADSANTLSVWSFEYRTVDRDGTVRWLSGNAMPEREPDGAILWHGFISDITHRKAADALLEQAVVSANAANTAKSRFLANMSHELRTPMNGVLGMAQLLLSSELPLPKQKEYVHTILSSGNVLLRLLNDILDLSKVEAGKMELETLEFLPAQLLQESGMLFAQDAKAKGLDFQVRWAGNPDIPLHADSHRVRQMISNLLSNGLKFTHQGFIRLEGRVFQELEPATVENEALVMVEISVTDSGIGIPAVKFERLFKPFSQIDESTTRQYGGTGLGLSIVRAVARQMGGDAGIESQEGVGSRVWFQFQARVARTVLAHWQADRLVSPLAPLLEHPSTTTGTVLVVEDIALNRMVIEALLTEYGVAFTSVENGQLAVQAIADGLTPHVILMDCQMPVMDGYAATRAIRAWELAHGKPAIPIVALTADAFEEDRNRCMVVGMNDFLAKPINFGELSKILKKWGLSLPMKA